MTRFVHSGDWQLGMTRHFLSADAQPRFGAARVDAIRTIGTLAQAEGCAFVVVCGDVFESNHVERHVVVRALDAMGATPSVRFLLLPGNHDPLDAASVFRSRTFLEHRPPNVVVLDGEVPVPVEPGVEVVAAPWRTKRPLGDLLAEVTAPLPADGTLRIVVGHGAVDALSPDRSDPALVSLSGLEAGLARGAFHYVALGDRHSTTSVGTSGRVWYSGAPEPTDYVESDAGNVLVVDLTRDTVRVDPHPVGSWHFVRHEAELTGGADCEHLGAFLGGLADKDRTIVRLALRGQLSLADHARLVELLDHHRDLLGALEVWDRRSDLVVLPDAGDFERLQLSGFAREALDDLRALAAETDDADDALVAQDALGLLYRLTGAPR